MEPLKCTYLSTRENSTRARVDIKLAGKIFFFASLSVARVDKRVIQGLMVPPLCQKVAYFLLI